MSINTADIQHIEPRSAVSAHRVGPYSRPHALARLDKRTREARFLKRVRDELTAYLGGSEHMTVPQRILVARVAVDLLRLELLDQKIARGEELTDHDGRIAHALRNSIRLMLRDLEGPQQAATSGSELIAAMIADHQEDRP